MASENGNEDGYRVPLQFRPHNEALEALLMTDSCEGFGQDYSRGSSQEAPRHVLAPARPVADGDSCGWPAMWVSPPVVQALREQSKQLQSQKRAKQRQQVMMDANPSLFDVPQVLQRNQRSQGSDRENNRSYQLVGASPAQLAVSASFRRERDGAVLVPLRMMASLAISSEGASAVTAVPAETSARSPAFSLPGIQGLHLEVGAEARVNEMPALSGLVAPTSSAARSGSVPQPDTDMTARLESQAANDALEQRLVPRTRGSLESPVRQHLQRRSTPVPGALAVISPAAALPSEQLFIADLGEAFELSYPRRPQQHHQHPPQQLQKRLQQQEVESQEDQVQQLAMGAPAAARILAQVEAEDDGDGAMLIDMGSADRAAEGALLPTPERPRSQGAGTGWDALRGLGLGLGGGRPDGAAAPAAGGVAATLALLSPRQASAAAQDLELQQPEIVPEDDGHEAASSGRMDTPGQIPEQSRPLRQKPSPLQPARGDGEAVGEEADEGFEADDEGETARRDERARVALRLTTRSAKFRPLPGLTVAPPWASLSFGGASSDLHGLGNLSELASALPATLSATEPTRQSHAAHVQLPSLDVRMMHLSVRGAVSGSGPGGDGADVDTDPTLADLLKLKCSLRRAVQNNNAQAISLILSLLAALPMTPGLLADSQVAALVSPLQQHGSPQVAAAARHLIAVWKGVLKAAVRQTAAGPGYLGPAGGVRGGPTSTHDRHGSSYQAVPVQPVSALHAGPSGSNARASIPCRDDAREWDVPMRDQTQLDQQQQQQQESGMRPPERHLRLLSLARSQSDVLADIAAAAAGAAAVGHRTPRSPPAALQLVTELQASRVAGVGSQGQPTQGAAQPAAALRQEAFVHASRWRREGKPGRSRAPPAGESPSGSRTVTEVEAGAHSSDDLAPARTLRTTGGDAATPSHAADIGRLELGSIEGRGAQPYLPIGSGRGSEVGVSCSGITEPLLQDPAGATLTGLVQAGPTAMATSATHAIAAHSLLSPAREPRGTPVASTPSSGPNSGLGVPTPGGDGGVAGSRENDGCGSFSPAFQGSWRPSGPVQGCGSLLAGAEALPAALRSPVSAALAPPTPAAMLLVPPPMSQPSGRKRKVDRDRPSSRRRSVNPNKRAAASGVAGQFAGPRPVHPSHPLVRGPDGAGSLSDDQRQPPLQAPHGPVTGLKTPARSTLLSLHAPHSKRQRHHVSGAAGQHSSAGGHHTATQVRRVSLLMSSLDLGGGMCEGSELRTDKTKAALEGDADADADMGSQDDEAAMLTSDNDGAVGSGAVAGGIENADVGNGSTGRRGHREHYHAARLRPNGAASAPTSGDMGPGSGAEDSAVGLPAGACGGSTGAPTAAAAVDVTVRLVQSAACNGVHGGALGHVGAGPGIGAGVEKLPRGDGRMHRQPGAGNSAVPLGGSTQVQQPEVSASGCAIAPEPGSTIPAAGREDSTSIGAAAEPCGGQGATQAVLGLTI